MADIHEIGEKGGDARHSPVERALDNARAEHEETPALGMLELAKHELLYGAGE